MSFDPGLDSTSSSVITTAIAPAVRKNSKKHRSNNSAQILGSNRTGAYNATEWITFLNGSTHTGSELLFLPEVRAEEPNVIDDCIFEVLKDYLIQNGSGISLSQLIDINDSVLKLGFETDNSNKHKTIQGIIYSRVEKTIKDPATSIKDLDRCANYFLDTLHKIGIDTESYIGSPSEPEKRSRIHNLLQLNRASCEFLEKLTNPSKSVNMNEAEARDFVSEVVFSVLQTIGNTSPELQAEILGSKNLKLADLFEGCLKDKEKLYRRLFNLRIAAQGIEQKGISFESLDSVRLAERARAEEAMFLSNTNDVVSARKLIPDHESINSRIMMAQAVNFISERRKLSPVEINYGTDPNDESKKAVCTITLDPAKNLEKALVNLEKIKGLKGYEKMLHALTSKYAASESQLVGLYYEIELAAKIATELKDQGLEIIEVCKEVKNIEGDGEIDLVLKDRNERIYYVEDKSNIYAFSRAPKNKVHQLARLLIESEKDGAIPTYSICTLPQNNEEAIQNELSLAREKFFKTLGIVAAISDIDPSNTNVLVVDENFKPKVIDGFPPSDFRTEEEILSFSESYLESKEYKGPKPNVFITDSQNEMFREPVLDPKSNSIYLPTNGSISTITNAFREFDKKRADYLSREFERSVTPSNYLSERHIKDLEKSCLSKADCEILGIRTSESGDAYTIPVYPINDTEPKGYRARIDETSISENRYPGNKSNNPEETNKYSSSRGLRDFAYFPRIGGVNWEKVITSPETPIFITEGEKKAALLTREGYSCIGITGVSAWTKGKKYGFALIDDLHQINWENRTVYIAFDSDQHTNNQIKIEQGRLADQLKDRGARVKFINLKKDGPKGIDDFFYLHGDNAVHEFNLLVQSAQSIK